jgi:hypothetical protein
MICVSIRLSGFEGGMWGVAMSSFSDVSAKRLYGSGGLCEKDGSYDGCWVAVE